MTAYRYHHYLEQFLNYYLKRTEFKKCEAEML